MMIIPANPGFECIEVEEETNKITRQPVIAWQVKAETLKFSAGTTTYAERMIPITVHGEAANYAAIKFPDDRVTDFEGKIYDSFYDLDKSLGN